MKPTKWNWAYPFLSVLLLGGFMWAIHDRYLPIQEEWRQYYTLMMNRGMLPYRDFYYFTQPISLFISLIISKIGEGYMLYRYYGMIERTLVLLTLYYLVARHFSPTATFIAVTTSAFVYQAFYIDVLYTYNQTTLLFFLMGLICLQLEAGSQKAWLYDGCIGFFAALAFFTKQSSGLFVTLFFFIILAWRTPRRSLPARWLRYCLGWALPAVIVLGWLVREHIFFQYLGQVFGGLSEKGSLLEILFGFWVRNSAVLYLGVFLLVLAALFYLWRKRILAIVEENHPLSQLGGYQPVLFLAFPLFCLGGFLIPPNKSTAVVVNYLGVHYLMLWMYLPFYFLAAASVLILVKWVSRKSLPFSQPISELILASFVWFYSTGLSDQLELFSAFLGTAIVLAFILDHVQMSWKHFTFGIISAACFVLFASAAVKNQIPYAWWGWNEYGHQQNATSIIPELKGFKLSPETVHIYDRIYDDIIQNTRPGDTVYTYPFLPLFNYVTGRLQPTFSPVHYFDVCPDSIAIQDAATLIARPPMMIVSMEMPESVIALHEQYFRNGQKSGQRALESAIVNLVNRYHYTKIDSFTSQGWDWPIYVWLKP